MNRSLTLLVALVVVATQVFVSTSIADEPTPARRPANQDQSSRNTAHRESATRKAPMNQEVAPRGQPVGSGVSRPTARPNSRPSNRNKVQQAGGATRRSNGSGVAQASHAVVGHQVSTQEYDPGYDSGEYIVDEGSSFAGSGASCDTCGSGSCGGGCEGLACGSPCRTNWGFDLCNPGRGGRQLCICLPSHGWVQMDFLSFYQRGMNIPPLLTTQTPGPPNLLLGNQDILTERISGGRIRFGWWFANNPNLGIEGEYIGLEQSNYNYRNAANGTPILARPFFNVVTGQDDSQLISNAGTGTFRVDAFSQFDGAAVRFRRSLCCSSGSGCSPFDCGPVPTQSRIDATLGWRFFQLKEGLDIGETVTGANNFVINDSFQTRNQFNGVEMGVLWQGRRGYWSLDGLMRVSLGTTLQTININGSTTINSVTPPGRAGGLLALQSNIGTYTDRSFGVVPEFGLNLGYQLTPRWRAMAGYNFIYWSNVVRPGDQIDTDVNPNQFPSIPAAIGPIIGADRPRFTLQESDYWVQGVNLGLEYRW